MIVELKVSMNPRDRDVYRGSIFGNSLSVERPKITSILSLGVLCALYCPVSYLPVAIALQTFD